MRDATCGPYSRLVNLVDRLRTTRLDAVLAAAFVLVGLVQTWIVPIADSGVAELYVLGSTLPLAWRRTFPVEAALTSAAFWLIPLDGFPLAGFVVVILQFFALGHRGDPGRAVAATGVLAVATSVVGTLMGPEAPVAAIGAALVVIAPTLAGRLVRRQQRQNDALVELTRELAEERARTEQAAVGAERARIAQELHDVVGHEVTLIAIQAEAAASALRSTPDRAAESIEAIRLTAHRTLDEIRAGLGLLAPDGQPEQPGDELLTAVAERARHAGIENSLEITGTPAANGTPVSLAVNRIVRECLTNAGRHAPEQPVELRVTWTPSQVEVHAANRVDRTRKPSPGRGLTGMRHRAELLGGTFEAENSNGWFTVHVTVPAVRS